MFKDRFKILRTTYKSTQSEIAEFMDVSVQAVYQWERGLNIPNVETIIKLAGFFDVSVDYLLSVDDKRYIHVTGLSDEEIAHIQNIVNDIKRIKLSKDLN